MKSFFLPLLTATALGGATLVAAPFTNGNLVVLQIETGNPAFPPNTGPGTLVEIRPGGTIVQTIPIPSGSGGVVFENLDCDMSRSADGSRLLLPGYRLPFASNTDPINLSDADAPRVYVEVDAAGEVGTPVRVFSYGFTLIGSVAQAESLTWISSAFADVRLVNGASPITVASSTAFVHLRPSASRLFLNRNGPDNNGIYAFPSFPTALAVPTFVAPFPAATSCLDFVVNESGTAIYGMGINGGPVAMRFDQVSTNSFSLNYGFSFVGATPRGIHATFGSSPRVWIANSTEILSGFDTGFSTTLATIMSAPSGSEFFQIDAVPAESNAPVLVIRQPASARTTTTAARARIRGRVTDDSGVASLSYRLGRRTVELAPTGRFSFTVRLRPGRNVVRLTARDYSGNRASARRVFLRT